MKGNIEGLVTNTWILFAGPPNASLATHTTRSIDNEAINARERDPSLSPIPICKIAGRYQIR